MTTPTVVDLFSGAGGLSLGAARAGFSVVGAVELDKQSLDAHRQNFPSTTHVHADVATLRADALAAVLALPADTSVTGLIGGPPCQGFSVIGKNRSDDPRNSLFDDFFRLVGDVTPRFFLAENVPGILNDKHAHILQTALDRVTDRYVVLPASGDRRKRLRSPDHASTRVLRRIPPKSTPSLACHLLSSGRPYFQDLRPRRAPRPSRTHYLVPQPRLAHSRRARVWPLRLPLTRPCARRCREPRGPQDAPCSPPGIRIPANRSLPQGSPPVRQDSAWNP